MALISVRPSSLLMWPAVKSRIHRGRLAVREHLIARGWRPGNPRQPKAVVEE